MKKIFLFLIICLSLILTSCAEETDSMWDMDKPEGWTEDFRQGERLMRPEGEKEGSTFVLLHTKSITTNYFRETDFKEFLSDGVFEQSGLQPSSGIEAASSDFLNYKFQREFTTPSGQRGIRAIGFAEDKMVMAEGYASEAHYEEMKKAVESLHIAGGFSPHDYLLKNFNTFWIVVLFIATIFDGMFVCESIKMRRKRPKDYTYYTRCIKIACGIFACILLIFTVILWPCPQLMWKYLLAESIIFAAFVAFGLTIFMRKFVETFMGQLTD